MTYPQTFAQEVGKNMEMIGKYGCLAMCYLYCMGIHDTVEMIRIVSDCMDKGILDNECTVTDARKYLQYVTGKNYDVEKKQFNDMKKVNCYPVRYTYNGKGHWVVVENGRVVFNSLINSLCVTKGAPAKDSKNPNTRVITLAR